MREAVVVLHEGNLGTFRDKELRSIQVRRSGNDTQGRFLKAGWLVDISTLVDQETHHLKVPSGCCIRQGSVGVSRSCVRIHPSSHKRLHLLQITGPSCNQQCFLRVVCPPIQSRIGMTCMLIPSIRGDPERLLHGNKLPFKRPRQTDHSLQVGTDYWQLFVRILGEAFEVGCIVFLGIIKHRLVVHIQGHTPPFLCNGNKMMQFAISNLGLVLDSSRSNKPDGIATVNPVNTPVRRTLISK